MLNFVSVFKMSSSPDIGLEQTRPEAHNDQSNDEASCSSMRAFNDSRNGRDNQDDVTDQCNKDSDADGVVPAPVGIC